MRVGLVLDDDIASPNGVQQVVRTLAEELVADGHEAVVFCADSGIEGGCSVDFPVYKVAKTIRLRFNGNRTNAAVRPLRLTRQVRSAITACDVLHVQAPYGPVVGHRLVMRARPGVRVVASFHMASRSRWVTAAIRVGATAMRRSVKRADAVTCDSDESLRLLSTTWHRHGVVIPNPIPKRPSSVAPMPASTQGSVIQFVFLGRLVERKGCEDAIRAIASSGQPHGSWRLVVVGDGPRRRRAEQLVSDLDIAEMVEFVGAVSESEKYRYLLSADVAVLPADSGESFGIVLLEAISAGTPVVGYANGGYAYVLGDDEEGLVAPGDLDGLSHVIARAAGSEQYRRALWRRQYAQIDRFQPRRVLDEYLAVYRS